MTVPPPPSQILKSRKPEPPRAEEGVTHDFTPLPTPRPGAVAAARRLEQKKRRTHGMTFKVEPEFYRAFSIAAIEAGKSNVELLETLFEQWNSSKRT
jgi:hypothetical protein